MSTHTPYDPAPYDAPTPYDRHVFARRLALEHIRHFGIPDPSVLDIAMHIIDHEHASGELPAGEIDLAASTYPAEFETDIRTLKALIDVDACHPADVVFEAFHGAPGIGQSWVCRVCGKHYVKLGGGFIDPESVPDDEEPPWIMSPADCI